LRSSHQAYHTQINDILLTAVGYALEGVTGNQVNHIILEGHGREEIDSEIDVSQTMGWFTTMYPVRLELGCDVGSSIKNIKEQLREIPYKGIGYGALQGYCSEVMPKISFNYLGQFDQEEKGEENSSWRIVGEGSGIAIHPVNKDDFLIHISGGVIDKRLKMSIMTQLNESITSKISRLFEDNLCRLISHCTSKTTCDYSMSDFEDFEPYIMLNGSMHDNKSVLFLFPPGNAGSESYLNNIASHLNHKKMVSFNNYYLYLHDKFGKESVKNKTYESLAEDYILYIKRLQPKGPYDLFGWSFGAVLAFEIARQMISRGEQLRNLILIDPFFKYKEAVLTTNSESFEANNINYSYAPLVCTEMNDVNLVLFKALKPFTNASVSLEQRGTIFEHVFKIYEYYAKNTLSNHLDQVLVGQHFNVINMEHDHISWIDDEIQVKKICNVIGK
jgi:non-ribosomal peptide synthase protein (TIGR01720 family)